MGAVGGKQITQQHRICMDDIVLEKIEAPEIKPEETGKNLLTNGDFSDGTSGWGINTNADQKATTVVTHGGIVFHVTNPGVMTGMFSLISMDLHLKKDVNIV